MTYKNVIPVLILLFFTGCASVPVNSKEILEFSIKPDRGIKPGSFIMVTVKTADVVEKVSGYLDVAGSPKIPFRYDAKKKAWIFAYVIPVTLQVPRGEFSAKIEATGKNGEKYTAEKKISTY